MRQNIKLLREMLYNDGVVHVRQLHSEAMMKEIEAAVQENLEKPSPFGHEMKSDKGSFFMDFNNWRRLSKVENICKKKNVIDLILSLTNSTSCWLFHDHLLVKSGFAPATPWHHDRPYYCVKGDLNLSVWTPTKDVGEKDGMVFLKGSHKSNCLYAPSSFRTGKNIELKQGYELIDDILLNSYEHLSFEMKRGDALIFFNTTIHGANEHKSPFKRQSLSVRYLVGDPKLTKKFINATPPFDRMGLALEENGAIPENYFPRLA